MVTFTAKKIITVCMALFICIFTVGCSNEEIVINSNGENETVKTEEKTTQIENQTDSEALDNTENLIAKDIFTNASIFCTECEMNKESVKDGYYRIEFSKGTIFSNETIPLHSEFLADFLIVKSPHMVMSDNHFFYEDEYSSGYGFVKIKNGLPDYVYYTSANPEQTTDYKIGVYPENANEDFNYNSFNVISTSIDQSALDEMSHEIFDLTQEAFNSLSRDDQNTLVLGAAPFEEILEWSGYSINKANSDFLRKFALEPWVHIDVKLNYFKDNSDKYNYYVEYVSFSFDDNCAYVNSDTGAKGIYNNPINNN